MTFKDAVCVRFGCSEQQYERVAFRRCLHWQGRLTVWFIRLFSRQAFEGDFTLIRSVGKAQSVEEMVRTINIFRDVAPEDEPLLHLFKIRVSGRKLIQLAQELFSR